MKEIPFSRFPSLKVTLSSWFHEIIQNREFGNCRWLAASEWTRTVFAHWKASSSMSIQTYTCSSRTKIPICSDFRNMVLLCQENYSVTPFVVVQIATEVLFDSRDILNARTKSIITPYCVCQGSRRCISNTQAKRWSLQKINGKDFSSITVIKSPFKSTACLVILSRLAPCTASAAYYKSAVNAQFLF